MERAIIHINVADFAVAVERLKDPGLKGRPVIVAPEGAARASVFDMSEEAYQSGIRKGMPLIRAARLCREATILNPNPDQYERAMGALVKEALPFSPLIETGEDDGHLFVDVTGTSRLWGPSVDVAWRMSRNIQKDISLSPIWSVAPNKLVAKAATRLVKPLGEYIVGAGEEAAFLAPLPMGLVPGVEAKDMAVLSQYDLFKVRQVAAWSLDHLLVAFGKRAWFLHEAVRGMDASPVLGVGQKPAEVRETHVFDEDTNDSAAMEAALLGLCEKAGTSLRRERRAAGLVRVHIRYSDGICRERPIKIPDHTADDFSLFAAARRALYLAWTRRVRTRCLGLTCSKLVFFPAQRELFPDPKQIKRARITSALDSVRLRYGTGSIRVARAMAA